MRKTPHVKTITSYIGGQWQPAVLFGTLILILVFRPSGLLGSTAREKGCCPGWAARRS